jgi:hypothetical protein
MRPRRLYVDTNTDKPYYIINKKKVYVKVPKNISLKQLQKVNIKNIVNIPERKRVKKKTGKRILPVFSDKIATYMKRYPGYTSIPSYIFKEKQKIPELSNAHHEFIPQSVKLSLELPKELTMPKPFTPQIMNAPVQPPLAIPITKGIPILENVSPPATPNLPLVRIGKVIPEFEAESPLLSRIGQTKS